ncbi:unnamed protein product [Cladocopium goreaui]|uniref:Uncharacterized protein n=1 Tax=Cladocopium goreaui TaxID=2562237 RepID=A0A9P1DC12_9DINO|nr:unnamed protein product [Cladocopium goreaui]
MLATSPPSASTPKRPVVSSTCWMRMTQVALACRSSSRAACGCGAKRRPSIWRP